MNSLDTIADIIGHIEKRPSNSAAMNYLEGNQWVNISTNAFIFDLKRLTYGLHAFGLRKGDSVGILSDSSPRWTIADLAIIMAGGISVPLFARMSHENFIYECAQANVRFLFVQGADHWKMYDEHRNLFEKVIGLDDPIEGMNDAMRYQDILFSGEELWKEAPKLWEEFVNQQHPDDICTIIYSAGSSGMPKGVQLSHQNLCHLVRFEVFGWQPSGDRYLNILPLAHVFARQINLILLGWGVSIYYLNDLSQLMRVCREIKPTLMIVVPRILEKLYAGIEGTLKGGKKGWKARISSWAFSLAANPSLGLIKTYLFLPVADFLVYRAIRRSLGGCWRVILSGGAALDKRINHFFLNVGIPVYEGWGLTEASTACVNAPGKVKVGTVGKPLPGVKVKVSHEGELLLAGPTIMKGYYRNPEATKKVIDEEGWLHTGDKGEIDQEGFVKITGRIKEQFKLSSGEYVSPSKIEYLLKKHPLIDHALVVGEKEKYLVSLLFPDSAFLERLKAEHQMELLSRDEFLQSSYVKAEVQNLLDQINQKVNSWEKLVKYRWILQAPTIENGLLTPTLKLRREIVLQTYQQIIRQMYEEK